MKAIKNGITYDIYDDSLQTFDRLPAKTYTVYFSQQSGFHLKEHTDLEVNEKVYGVHEEKAEKVLRSFAEFPRNLGVILSGDKGIGKSMFARLLCKNAVRQGSPVIIVDQSIPGIASYIESIEQECVVLFDEFDKVFASNTSKESGDRQTQFLSLFDGVANGKKLFIVTCNELRGLNSFLVNRPGRFHYHFRFEYPSPEEIREYMTDHLSPECRGEIEDVVAFSRRVNLNYDCLRAIAFELNRGYGFKDAIQDLNIVNTESSFYRVTLYFTDGTNVYNRSVSMDLFDTDTDPCVSLENKSGDDVGYAVISTGNAVYDPMTGSITVNAEDISFTTYNDDDGRPYKDKKVSHMTIARVRPKSIRYFDA